MKTGAIARRLGPALALLAVFGALLYLQRAGQGGPRVTSLAAGPATNYASLRAAFNRDAGKVRLLLLLDPT
jgi:hypothetical protein